ncbi:cell cycle regulator of non-homologous end joining isoform X2 [Microtus pennsylvanicus]
MNEAEMVDVALGILIEGRKQETASLVTTDKLQLSPPYSASPHTSSPGSSSEEEGSGSSSPALHPSPSQRPEAADLPCSSSPKEEKEEEDVLKYVREIFFS